MIVTRRANPSSGARVSRILKLAQQPAKAFAQETRQGAGGREWHERVGQWRDSRKVRSTVREAAVRCGGERGGRADRRGRREGMAAQSQVRSRPSCRGRRDLLRSSDLFLKCRRLFTNWCASCEKAAPVAWYKVSREAGPAPQALQLERALVLQSWGQRSDRSGQVEYQVFRRGPDELLFSVASFLRSFSLSCVTEQSEVDLILSL